MSEAGGEKQRVRLKRYKESEREDIIQYGGTDVRALARAMRFDALMFWVGLGILLAHGCAIKAQHDKLIAWLPGTRLHKIERWALKRTGQWFKGTTGEPDDEFIDDAWSSFWPGG